MRTHAVGSLVALYLSDLDARRCSEATKALSRQALARFALHLRERRVRDLRAVDVEELTAFARRLQQERSKKGGLLSHHTRAAFLSRVRALFAFLEKRGVILSNPALGLALPAVRRLPRCVLSPRKAAKLMEAPDPSTAIGKRDRAVLELLYGTGLRASECAGLDLVDLDLKQGTLMVRDGKGRRDRVVPIPGRATRAIETYLAASRARLADERETALFVSRHGGRLSGRSLRDRLRAHGSVSPHGLRHACATHLLQGGADVRHIQELLGHKRIETTALYTRVDVTDLRTMLRRSHPRERAHSRRCPRARRRR